MIQEYKLSLVKGSNEIIFRYIEAEYPITDTKIFMYDMYKLNIMLSDGLAAILRETNDIYNSFSGDLFFFNPEEIHNGRILRQGVHKYIEILIPRECFSEFKSYDFLFNDSSSKRTNVLSPSSKERTLILSLAEKIIDFIGSPLDNIFLLSYLTELLMICTRLYGNNDKRDINQNVPAALNSAMIFMRENFSENIRMEEIAAASNCSISYLSRIFKRHLGKSPYRYLTEYRLFEAEKLIRYGYSVTDVASMAGFSDSSVFIKYFKESFGMTPLKYKEHSKQKTQ